MFIKSNTKLFVSLSLLLPLISACSLLKLNQQQDTKRVSQVLQKPGVQLWADNCSRCHTMRSPDSYSDAQWDVAILHMRIRANLTADDAKEIVEYLKLAN